MNSYLTAALLGCATGLFGTGLGGLLSTLVDGKSEKLSSFLMGISGGVVLSVVICSMAPEAVSYCSVPVVIIFAILGALAVELLHRVFPHMGHGHTEKNTDSKPAHSIKKNTSPLAQTGILLCLGVAIHNLPDGLAIGAGIEGNSTFGIVLAVLLLIHNIPEGLAMGIPLKLGGFSRWNVVLLTLLSGIPTVIGALLGALIGNISESVIGAIIAFAAGAMLYLTIRELIPSSIKMSKPLITLFAAAIGAAIGGVTIFLLG